MILHRYKSYESVLKFSDGVTVDTSGPYRTLKLADGWYVVGDGRLIPVDNEQKAQDTISKLFRDVIENMAYEIVSTPNKEGQVANKLLFEKAKSVIKKYASKLKMFGVTLDPNRMDPVLVYDFLSDLDHLDNEKGIEVSKFKVVMSEWLDQSVKESFEPKKLETRREDLIKKHTKENEIIKKYVLGKGSYVRHIGNFETSITLRNKMKSKLDYSHSVMGDVFYFVTKEENVELPIKAVNWKLWVERLSNIEIDKNGYIEKDFEPYYAKNEKLNTCLWWISWYFEVPKNVVKKEYDNF